MPKRVAIDTGIARELSLGEPAWYSALVEMREHGWSFHLTDVSIAEIIASRERGSVTSDQWAAGSERLDSLLGEYFPCLPGKRELFHLCGFHDEEDPNEERLDEDFLSEYSKGIWETLRQPIGASESEAEVTFSVGQQTYRCPVQPGQAATVLEQERAKWIAEMSRDPQADFDYQKAIDDYKQECDSWAKTDGVPMSIRGDILAHANAEYERRIASGYNPASPKRRNDGIDFLLPLTFLWPAILLTTDKNLHRLLRGLNSFQAHWTFLPDELAAAWSSGDLTEPDWPNGGA